MTDLPTLISLRDRVRAATGPDRELDGEIMFTLFAVPAGKDGFLWPEDNPSWSFAHRFPGRNRKWFDRVRGPKQETIVFFRDGDPILMNALRVPALTASLDAAIALKDQVLPGWRHRWQDEGDGVHEFFLENKGDFGAIDARHTQEFGVSGPLAALASLLSALIAREEAGHGE